MTRDIQNNILIVLLVIGLSYVFVITGNSLDIQMAFIFLSLTILIIYKQLNNSKVTPEGFEVPNADIFRQINAFVSESNGVNNKTVEDNNIDVKELKKSAKDIKDNLSKVLANLTAIRESNDAVDNNNSINYSNANMIDIAAVQTLQNEQTKTIQEKIKATKQMLRDKENENASRTYPKIPVYSSCIVANASGDYTVDEPIKDNMQTGNNTKLNDGIYSTSGTWSGILDESGNSIINNNENTVDGQQNNGLNMEQAVLGFLKSVSDKGIDISLA